MANQGRGDIRLLVAASAISAGFLVDVVGWRPVYLGGGMVDAACAAALAASLGGTPGHPAESGPQPLAAKP